MNEEHTDIAEPCDLGPFDRLPQELVIHIISYLFPAEDQKNQGHLLYVNWAIYDAALPYVYKAPRISSANLVRFCDTITARRTAWLGDFVQVLNLRRVIHGAKASQMSRLVRRCSKSLHEFYAPQVGFAQSAFRAVGLCSQIKILDLNAVSEKVELSFFLAAISKAESLETINFPRFSKHTDGPLTFEWPPKLKRLWLSGAINDDFLSRELPRSVDSIVLQNCPSISLTGLLSFLERVGPQIRNLTTLYPLNMPSNALDLTMILCPNLTFFKGFVDYFTQEMFQNIPEAHPLETLVLDSAGGLLDRRNKISPDDLSLAIVEGRLSHLRQVRWSLQVGWRSERSDVQDLGDLLADADGNIRSID